MNVEAGEELEQNEKEILKHLGGDKALPWLIDLYKRAGNYHRVYRLGESRGARRAGRRSAARRGHARDVGGGVSARLPAAGREVRRRRQQPGAVSLRDHAQGIRVRPARRLVRGRARPAADDPADQHAGRGRRSGEPFFADQLYEPEINVRLGAIYIGQLYGKFGRELQLTAGAYNGGPRMMARWCEQNGKYPTDEFVELIAFPQTREYVKRVTTIYAKYRYLYGSGSVRDSPDAEHQGRQRTDLLSANERCPTESVPNNCSPWKWRSRRPAPAVTRARATSGFNSTIAFDQARIHAASIYCSDGRFGEQMDEFLHQGLGLPRYDRLAVPGGPACLSGALSVFWESHSAERQLDFLCHVHKLERLIMIAHEGCAFYLEWLKVKPEEFAARQMEDVKRAATRVRRPSRR